MSEQMQLAIYQSLTPAQIGVAIRAEERIKSRTVVTVIENGKDLIEVKASLGHGYFMAWVDQAFPMLNHRTMTNWMNAAERYGGKLELSSNLGSKVMQLLAAPSTPDEVRTEVEDRAMNGEKITVAEVERLKSEAKHAREAEERLRLECKELAETSGENAKLARNLEKQLDLLREGADAEIAKAAEKAREEARKEAKAALNKAEADAEKCRQAAEDAQKEAEEAFEAAEAARSQVADSVKKAVEEAGRDAGARAEKMADEALAKRRSELQDLERRAQRAQEKADKYVEAERQLAETIRKHQDRIKTIGSSELEAPAQIESAKRLISVIYDAMTDIHGFDHEPTHDAAKQWDIAGQMCVQLAEAIRAFCAPRLESDTGENDG